MTDHPDTRESLRSLAKRVPGMRPLVRGSRRLLSAAPAPIRRWWAVHVRRDPTEIVKSNTKEAFDAFFGDREFVENTYLAEERRVFFGVVAEYCATLVGPDAEVIDIGCGTGHFLHELNDRLGGRCTRLYGMDFSESALGLARELLPGAALSQGDIYAIPAEPARFDLVVCMEVLEHLREPERAMRELIRVAKPSGDVVITVPDGDVDDWEGHFNFWNELTLAEFVGRFADVRRILPLPDHGAILCHARPTSDLSHLPADAPRGGS